jgi:hypothetical protein
LDFFEPLAIVAVGLPYAIKNRFAFAIAHLCHQANRAHKGKDWRDDLTLDRGITISVAKRLGDGWKSFEPLEAALDKLNDKAFTAATHDFRHAYNHRLSPRFVIGITQTVKRRTNPNAQSACYAFGGDEPLDLAEVSVALAEQRDHCYSAFDAFQALVHEHADAIASETFVDARPPLANAP